MKVNMIVKKITTATGHVFYTKEPITPQGMVEAAKRLGWAEINQVIDVEMTDEEYIAIPTQPEADLVFGDTPL